MTISVSGRDWEPFLFGAAGLEVGTRGLVVHRYPAWARKQVEDPLFRYAEACPVGASIRFETDADEVELTVASTAVVAAGAEPAQILLVVRHGGGEHEVPLTNPTVLVVTAGDRVVDTRPAGPERVRIPTSPAGPVEVYLPHNAMVELVSLSASGSLTPAAGTGIRWTHYGSSISQGLNAVSAVRTWPVAAARRLGWALRNLSLAGNAQLDGFAARVIRDTPADVITIKTGINLVNADSMRERTFRPAVHAFLDTIREGQPQTPIVLISAIVCPVHEDAPGPVVTGSDGRARVARRAIEEDAGALTLSRTREILAEVVTDREDDLLAYWDGRELLGAADTSTLADALHPDQDGLDLIAQRFAEGVGARLGWRHDTEGRHASLNRLSPPSCRTPVRHEHLR